METLFPLAETWWFYGVFTLFVLLLLVVDLGVFHRKAHDVSIKEAAIWSAVWVLLALAFNYGFYRYSAWRFGQDEGVRVGLEFLTGYIVEKTLSVDNIFVFVMVFGFFAIPPKYQHRVLFYGILGALVFRAIFIALGSVLVRYHLIVVLFGLFLIATGIKMMLVPSKGIDPEKNLAIRLLRRVLPVTGRIDGQGFLIRQDGALHATPLLVALVFIEFTDIIFAVDSVPAIFALTREPLIVYTSNIFAIMGLRAMYFLLSGIVDRFVYLKYGLAVVLVFVGLKMAWLNSLFGGKFPITWSLGIIGGLIAVSIGLSFLAAPRRAAGSS